MTAIHMESSISVMLTLSNESFQILKELQEKGESPDEIVDSMILAFGRCQSTPDKG